MSYTIVDNVIEGDVDDYPSYEEIWEELRIAKRGWWLARAERAKEKLDNTFWFGSTMKVKWQWVERKCREKAEEYK